MSDFKCHSLGIADFHLPLDKIEDVVIIGDINGQPVGDVTLVRGHKGNGVYTNGVDQWIDLGNLRSKCFGNVMKCTEGHVMSLWMFVYEQTTGQHYIFTSGAHTYRSHGTTLLVKNKKIQTYVRTQTKLWVIVDVTFNFEAWYHVTLTWSENKGSKLYFNGILVGDMVDPTAGNNNADNTHHNFVIGNTNINNENYLAEMKLDEMKMWDAVWDDDQVWQNYINSLL